MSDLGPKHFDLGGKIREAIKENRASYSEHTVSSPPERTARTSAPTLLGGYGYDLGAKPPIAFAVERKAPPQQAQQQQAAVTLCTLQLYDASSIISGALAGMRPGTVDGTVPSVFSGGDWLVSIGGYTEFYAHVSINTATGAVVSSGIGSGGSTPADSATDKYLLIGAADLLSAGDMDHPPRISVVNYRYGPADATVCRNWFSFDPITYGVTWGPGGCGGALGGY
jgi:hypothetical protein